MRLTLAFAAALVFLIITLMGHGPVNRVTSPSAASATPQSVTVRWGPYTVPAASGGTPGSTNNLFQWDVAMPCVGCYITEVVPNLVYEDGSAANHETMAMLHHMVAFSYGQPDATCDGTPLGMLGERIFASGNERSGLALPDGYGYYNGPASQWNLIVDIMNMMEEPQTMYLEFTFTYRPGTDSVKAVTPVWLDVDNCANSEYSIPAGYSDQHWSWTSSLEGNVIAIGGHVHDFGIAVSAEHVQTGSFFCTSVAGYAQGSPYAPEPAAQSTPGHPAASNSLAPGDPAYMEHIENMTGCATSLHVYQGDALNLHSQYNVTEAMADVMGIMMAYVHETTDPPDVDGDGVPDAEDNCPAWPNPSQALPPWTVPAGDEDCDGFPSTVAAGGRGPETAIGTDPADPCPDDASDDAWPMDFDMNTTVNIIDVLFFATPILSGQYDSRFDLNANGVVNIIDVLMFGPFMMQSCTNP